MCYVAIFVLCCLPCLVVCMFIIRFCHLCCIYCVYVFAHGIIFFVAPLVLSELCADWLGNPLLVDDVFVLPITLRLAAVFVLHNDVLYYVDCIFGSFNVCMCCVYVCMVRYCLGLDCFVLHGLGNIRLACGR